MVKHYVPIFNLLQKQTEKRHFTDTETVDLHRFNEHLWNTFDSSKPIHVAQKLIEIFQSLNVLRATHESLLNLSEHGRRIQGFWLKQQMHRNQNIFLYSPPSYILQSNPHAYLYLIHYLQKLMQIFFRKSFLSLCIYIIKSNKYIIYRNNKI